MQSEEHDMGAEGEEEEDDPHGVDLMGEHTGDEDSSEEEDDDSEAERLIREGFIVDEDESSSRSQKKKRRKHKGFGEDGSRKRRKDSDDDGGDLDEDDLALLEENTGQRVGARASNKKRLRRHREKSDASDEEEAPVGLNNIFDDDREPVDAGDYGDEMAGFIEDDDSQSDSSGRHASGSDPEEERSRRREKKRKSKSKSKPNVQRRQGYGLNRVEGITQEAWQEVTDVFGNGLDYADALDVEDTAQEDKELKDIFEPSELASRMLTTSDDIIKRLDIPERMQIASVGIRTLAANSDGPAPYIREEDIPDAVEWMSTRISTRCSEAFLVRDQNGEDPPLKAGFLKAVEKAIGFVNVDFLEVPFIWAHRSDFLVHFDPSVLDPAGRNTAFLNQADLWRISALSIKFRALVNRKQDLRALYDQIDVDDDYFEEVYAGLESIEEVADLSDWLAMKYATKISDLKSQKDVAAAEDGPLRLKRASRESRYQNAKRNVVSKLAELIGVSAMELSKDFVVGQKTFYGPDDPTQLPLDLAEVYVTGGEYGSAAVVLSAAKMILVHEISHDPLLKREARRYYKDYAVVTVTPTDLGIAKIDDMHPFNAFKYLKDKPIQLFLRSPQFLQIRAAESEGLVKSEVFLPKNAEGRFQNELQKLYHSDYSSSIAEAWNSVREEIINTAVKEHLFTAGETWARNYIQEEEEDFIGRQCSSKLDQRINVAPFCRSDGTMERGDIPSVLAISHGAGDARKDSVHAVYLDSEGNLREHVKWDDFHPEPDYIDRNQGDGVDAPPRQTAAFQDLLRRRRPQVIVVGGFSPNTKRLMGDLERLAQETSSLIVNDGDDDDDEMSMDERIARAKFEMTFVFDDVARIYQSSQRATSEFPELSSVGKYCVGLARYAQSPLNEYAALGPDLSAITYDPFQKLLSKDKVAYYLERALVEVVNKVGVDVNKAIRNSYYYHLLPYVAGLGPRKAMALVQKINNSLGGTLTSRARLVTGEVTPKNIFMNAAAFLRIPQDDLAADLKRPTDDEEGDAPDVLDDTRIHPEDYEVARKMAADAMEYDEEEIAALKTPSQAVTDVINDDPKKLDDLSLDDFASELAKILGVPKRLTLYGIRDEMQGAYADSRPQFSPPLATEIFTMLTGETPSTLSRGLIIPVRVVRIKSGESSDIIVRLDSGIDGTIKSSFRSDNPDDPNLVKPTPGQTLQALVIDINYENFQIELSTQESQIRQGDLIHRRVLPDTLYDHQRAETDKQKEMVHLKRAGRTQRLIKHPNFHNFSAGEAENFLRSRPRGECVIRPSSKEDHLAVTWKVDEGVFQHLAVFEMNKQSEQSIGTPLRIGKYSYVDLDELIFSHVKQMARKVEEMLAHDKCKGTQEQLHVFLQNFTMANPGQSAYGFGLDRSKPGQFVVSFRTDQRSEIQSWPIKVLPGVFSLLGEEHGDVLSLCNAFKTAYQNRSSSGNARLPLGRTPNPYAARLGGATPRGGPSGGSPAVLAGGRTPLAGGSRTPFRNDMAAGGRSPFPAGGLRGGSTPQHYANQGGGGAGPYPGTGPGQQPWVQQQQGAYPQAGHR